MSGNQRNPEQMFMPDSRSQILWVTADILPQTQLYPVVESQTRSIRLC